MGYQPSDKMNPPLSGAEPRGWKAWAEKELTRIRGSVRPGCRLAPDDEQFVEVMFRRRHPWGQRTGVIDAWYVRRDEQGYPRFEYARDGHFSPVAWKKLVSAPTHEALVKQAMRQAVRPQTEEVRDGRFRGLCALCSGNIRDDDDVHVDHEVPFHVLASQFADATGGWEAFSVEDADRPELAEPHRSQWIHFHRAVARLRPVHAACNMKRGKNA